MKILSIFVAFSENGNIDHVMFAKTYGERSPTSENILHHCENGLMETMFCPIPIYLFITAIVVGHFLLKSND